MSKPAPYRLLAESYPYRSLVQTRYADLDVNDHLNNVAIATLFEEGRVRFLTSLYDGELKAFGAVVVAASFSYVREGVYGVDIEMACGLAKIGNTSWTNVRVYRRPRPERNGTPTPISDAWRTQLSKYLITP